MGSPVVPTNNLQNKFKSHRQEILSPHTGTIHSIPGLIIEVYDPETLALKEPPQEVKEKIKETPGILYAKVKIGNDIERIWSFKEKIDYILLVYGNAALLQGEKCIIEYNGLDVYNGRIVIPRNYRNEILNMSIVCKTLDIGGII